MNTISGIIEKVSAEEIRKHIQSLQGIRHQTKAPEALERAQRYVARVLESHGYGLSEHKFDDDGRTFSNVIATRSGTVHPDRRLMVLAHFDTVSTSPGADDNASGVAVLLELARVLCGLQFERSIQFVGINLEEHAGVDGSGPAYRGSQALAGFARENGWLVDGVIVLESVAFAGDVEQSAPHLPITVPEKGDFIAVVANDNSREMALALFRAIGDCSIPLPYLPLLVPGNGELAPDTRRSDHAPFWDQGYKAIMLTDTGNFRNPHYHQPSDKLETLNLGFAAHVCRATAALIADLGKARLD